MRPPASDSAQQELLIVLGQEIAQRVRGVAEDQVHVGVDEAWQNRQTAQIDQFSVGRRLTHRFDANDPSVLHIQRAVALNTSPRSVNQPPCTDYLHQYAPLETACFSWRREAALAARSSARSRSGRRMPAVSGQPSAVSRQLSAANC